MSSGPRWIGTQSLSLNSSEGSKSPVRTADVGREQREAASARRRVRFSLTRPRLLSEVREQRQPELDRERERVHDRGGETRGRSPATVTTMRIPIKHDRPEHPADGHDAGARRDYPSRAEGAPGGSRSRRKTTQSAAAIAHAADRPARDQEHRQREHDRRPCRRAAGMQRLGIGRGVANISDGIRRTLRGSGRRRRRSRPARRGRRRRSARPSSDAGQPADERARADHDEGDDDQQGACLSRRKRTARDGLHRRGA